MLNEEYDEFPHLNENKSFTFKATADNSEYVGTSNFMITGAVSYTHLRAHET